ncbi:10374_t:CDS:2 [Cetraspora pellucida]|uniref:10374_t:CDS:1 n=1 Tax=Cetraspora pellucida TaxID=1433469 RepID=A0A9N9A3J0_9GLOM|nr:10374_t:CDS:2 [Cetraspora pellucida]
MFDVYKEVGMSLDDKWVGFVLDSVDHDPELQGKIITVLCMAHQTNLLVKKIIKSKQFEPIISNMLHIINHFYNSNQALAKLRELEENKNLTSKYPCKADKISSTSTINMLDKDDELDDYDYEVDEIISNLEEVSLKIINDIENLDPDN